MQGGQLRTKKRAEALHCLHGSMGLREVTQLSELEERREVELAPSAFPEHPGFLVYCPKEKEQAALNSWHGCMG